MAMLRRSSTTGTAADITSSAHHHITTTIATTTVIPWDTDVDVMVEPGSVLTRRVEQLMSSSIHQGFRLESRRSHHRHYHFATVGSSPGIAEEFVECESKQSAVNVIPFTALCLDSCTQPSSVVLRQQRQHCHRRQHQDDR